MRCTWDGGKAAWLKGYAPGRSWREISAEHERLYGSPLTSRQVKNAKARFGIKSGTVGGRFEKGHETWNKGMTWDEMMSHASQEKSRRTCYAKGNMPANGHQPIGTERAGQHGYVWVKVAARKTDQRSAHDNWVQKHRLAWERENGPIPDGCVVVFADGDRSNCDPANLALMTRQQLQVINHMGIGWSDRDTLDAAKALADLRIAAREKLMRSPRKCGVCGREFVPSEKQMRYAKPVSTCPSCIGAGHRGRRKECTGSSTAT